MKLKEIASYIADAQINGDGEVEILSLHNNSKDVKPGGLFVAIKGFNSDGHNFIEDALQRGASGLLVEKAGNYPVPYIKVNDARLGLAKASALFYGLPAEKMTMIGITGTNGKTTTAYMVEKILEVAGEKIGLFGTIVKRFGKKEFAGDRTTPESLELHRDFSCLFNEGGTHVVMEVSSHALELKRIAGILYDVAVFTNITPEHGEFHNTFADYIETKATLFKQYLKDSGTVVINKDDSHYMEMLEGVKRNVLTYSLTTTADITGTIESIDSNGLELSVKAKGEKERIRLHLTGSFNAYNALAAIGVGLALGLNLKTIKDGLEMLEGVPGRFETVQSRKGFNVVVDFAHSPDGLENLLKNASQFKKNKLIVVFGCGGDRDKSKRPKMGAIAAHWGDIVVVTSDNPRGEDMNSIINEIVGGIPKEKELFILPDREDAIYKAIALAKPGDLVVIAGKGHESEQIIGEDKMPFNDKSIAKTAIEELERGMEGGTII